MWQVKSAYVSTAMISQGSRPYQSASYGRMKEGNHVPARNDLTLVINMKH